MENTQEQREQHLKKYGSFLYCPDRDTLCVHMDGMWMTGCEREGCILDDPEYIALKKKQERIAAERAAAERAEKMKEREERKNTQIRDQRNQIKSYEEIEMEAIRRLEEKSRQAFYHNKPEEGHTLFNRAGIRRQQLKKYMDQKQGRKNPDPGKI